MKKATSISLKFLYSLFFIHLFFLVALVFYFRYSVQDIVYLLKSPEKEFLFLYLSLVANSLIFLVVLALIRRYLLKSQNMGFVLNPHVRRMALAFYLLAVLLFTAAAWVEFNLPNNDPNSVIFSLAMPMKGTDTTLVLRGFIEVPLYYLFLSLSMYYFYFPIRKIIKTKYNNWYVGICSSIFLVLSIVYFSILLQPLVYAENLQQGMKHPVPSTFYQTEYINPNSVEIQFPEKKKNLLFILMESMESSFQSEAEGGIMEENFIPELTKLAKENLNFSQLSDKVGGGNDMVGTSWTVAGMVSKSAGIPLHLPLSADPVNAASLLPNAVNLTQILGKEGYNLRYMFGSDKEFAARDLFWEKHGPVEMHDFNYYKKVGKLPEDYRVFWGFEDIKLYQFAKEELTELSSQEKPFFLGMLTVDTHFPKGFICEKCDPVYRDGELIDRRDYRAQEQYQTVLKCADRQISEFLEWCSTQSWYNDTLIVVMGDHLFMNVERDSIFPFFVARSDKMMEKRRWFDLFINSELEAPADRRYNREFSSFDMFPTILEAMGVQIEGHSLGLGRSLFSNQPTLIEKMGKEAVNREISVRTEEYEAFIK